jgi:hypothetical protein
MKVITEKGNIYYVSKCDDCGDNVGGYFCQVYRDENLEDEIDNFVVDAYYANEEGESIITDIVNGNDLNGDYDREFGTGEVKISICSNNVDVELYGDEDDCLKIAKLLNVNGNLYINDRLYN